MSMLNQQTNNLKFSVANLNKAHTPADCIIHWLAYFADLFGCTLQSSAAVFIQCCHAARFSSRRGDWITGPQVEKTGSQVPKWRKLDRRSSPSGGNWIAGPLRGEKILALMKKSVYSKSDPTTNQ